MAFTEKFVETDGFRIRYMEAGPDSTKPGGTNTAPVLVHLHGAGGLRLSPAHDLLARSCRVIAFEMPGFGASAVNTKSGSAAELATTMARAMAALDLDQVNLWGTSFGGRIAVWLAVQHPERLRALILDAPAAIRAKDSRSPSGTPEEMARMLFAHPERVPPMPALAAAIREQTQALVSRLRGAPRVPELERRMGDIAVPTLVLFGTLDRVISPEMGRHYKELIPTCNLVLVYDAGHAIGTDRPEAFADVVGDFIERREAFVISRAETMIHP